MIEPRIKFRNRHLMARQALEKLRVGTADPIQVRESFYQLSIEELQELPVLVTLLFLMQKANQDSPFSTSASMTTHVVPLRQQTSIKLLSRRDDGDILVIARASSDNEIPLGIQ